MKKKQVNIRIPENVAQDYKNLAMQLGIYQEALYTIALYDYLLKRGLVDAERKN